MADLLIELYSEEIPAGMQAGAAEQLKRKLVEFLDIFGVSADTLDSHVSAQRVALEQVAASDRLAAATAAALSEAQAQLAAANEQLARPAPPPEPLPACTPLETCPALAACPEPAACPVPSPAVPWTPPSAILPKEQSRSGISCSISVSVSP